MNYRLVFDNASVEIVIPATEVERLIELIEDPVLRWKPINVGTSGDMIVPAHVVLLQKM